jgi:histidine triad (HIT) family protein
MKHNTCVFCDIVARKLDACRVWENEIILAFMDQRQANPGHVLIIPKVHCPDIYTLPPASETALMRGILLVSRAVRDAFVPDGMNIWQSNGRAAGQEVMHLHFHVHPRWEGDSLGGVYRQKPATPKAEELEAMACRIRERLG